MAHETSIGKDQRIYEVTLSASATTIWDLMDQTQRDEIDRYDVLDGYIYVDGAAFFVSHKIGGAEEPFAPTRYAYFPFLDWHKKALVRGAGATPARIKMILGFLQRP
jgi:hypothetical protein